MIFHSLEKKHSQQTEGESFDYDKDEFRMTRENNKNNNKA